MFPSLSQGTHLGDPGRGALPVVGLAGEAAPGDGVADGQVAGAAVLVVLAACRRLRNTVQISAPFKHQAQGNSLLPMQC